MSIAGGYHDIPDWGWLLYFFLIGACVGSFLNVVIYRLPPGRSIIRPGSSCPSCGERIGIIYNIPILGYFFALGKCAKCGAKISPRYPVIELLTALLFSASFVRFGATPEAVVYAIFSASLIAITFIDIDHFIIPDIITLPGVLIGLVSSWLFLPVDFKSALLGALIGGLLFYILAVVVPEGMGGGDIKLIAMIGSFLGLKGALFTIFLSSLFGSLIGIAGIIAFGKTRKSKIPFGPFLAAGALAYLFWENELTLLYFDIFVM